MCRNNREFLIYCNELFKLVSPDNSDPTIFLEGKNCREFLALKQDLCTGLGCEYCFLNISVNQNGTDICDMISDIGHTYFGFSSTNYGRFDDSLFFKFSIDLLVLLGKVKQLRDDAIDGVYEYGGFI